MSRWKPQRAREWRERPEREPINASVVGATMAAIADLSEQQKRERILELMGNGTLRGRSAGEWWEIFGVGGEG